METPITVTVIENELTRLHNAIDQLAGYIAKLQERLAPVLNLDTVGNDKAPEIRVPSSLVARQVSEATDRVNAYTLLIMDTLERLEI